MSNLAGTNDAMSKMAAHTNRLTDSFENRYPFSQCHEIKFESKSNVFLFYLNTFLSVIFSLFDFFHENGLILLLSVILILVLYVVYKSYWSPVLYVKAVWLPALQEVGLHRIFRGYHKGHLGYFSHINNVRVCFKNDDGLITCQELTEIGFDHIPRGPDRAERIARAQKARRLGTKIPPPYPNGWFAVVESRDLKTGGVVAVDALGQNLCVYRGEDGVARCVDAYCPHLGANLAIGGNVCGNCIECPFHKWRFGESGACVSVPGVETAPKGVSIRTWLTSEVDGAVWIWHDAEDRPPLWIIEDAPELKSWGYRGRNEFIVGSHIQDIPENGADVAHLNSVHSTSLLTTLGEKYPILLNLIGRHTWSAEWTKNEDHTAQMKLTHDYKFDKFGVFHMDVVAKQIGPGHVRLSVQTPFGPFLISQSVTPLAPLQQRVIHRIFSPTYNAAFGAAFVRGESYMFERDVAIWNSKKYVNAPAYVRLDRTIRAFRSWYGQFYSENSVSFKDAIQNPLDW